MPHTVELGLIEGFYGRPWSWAARAHAAATLKPHGYNFYLYAPKADAYLRRRWREPHPHATELAGLSVACRAAGVRFGVGLSPYELYRNFDADARAVRKVREGERLLNDGKDLAEILRTLEISEATWNRWRAQYGGMKASQAKRLKELEAENARLKRLVANQALDVDMLKELAEGNF